MSRATNMCQIDDCRKRRQKKTIFCKRHEKKIPKKMMGEVKKFFRNHPDGYAVIDFDNLVKKCNFSLNIDDYEKRYKHHIKTQSRKLGKQKIYVVAGNREDPSEIINNEPWVEFWREVDSLKIRKYLVLIADEKKSLEELIKNPCAVILLGEAGVRATMYPGRAENGIYLKTIEKQAVTPEACFEGAWKDRPSSPRDSYNYYYQAPTISCEPHPEEYDEFGKGEIREITKCLTWAKQFLHRSKHG